jgi:DNA-binding response OmpR family regulator
VIVLGERHYEHAVAAFRAGAADYLRTPTAPGRLQATVQAVLDRRSRAEWPLQTLHRVREQLAAMQALLAGLEAPGHRVRQEHRADGAQQPAASQITIGSLTLGAGRKQVLLNGEPLAVSPIEYRLLRCLAQTPNEAVRFEQIAAQTHAYEATKSEANTMLKSHVRNLRRKLPAGCLVTVRGVGLMLSVSSFMQPERGPAAIELEVGS